MNNILVGFNSSRPARTAAQQSLELAEALGARLHFLEAIEPVGPGSEVEISSSDEPLAILDRMDAMMEGDEAPALPEDDDVGGTLRTCQAAGVPCSFRRLHGMAARVLRGQSLAMDLLVLAPQGATARRPAGPAASSILLNPLTATLLCREQVMPWERVLLAYEPTAAGGRALRLAGEVCKGLNIALDVVVAEADRDEAARSLEYATSVLRAYHIEGEHVQHRGSAVEALQTHALELESTVVVVPHRPRGALPFHRSSLTRAAISFPTAMPLVVP